MTKDELITKQQIEIEELKTTVSSLREMCRSASAKLWRPEQWSTKCPDFPKVAMSAIVKARDILNDS